MTIYNIKNEQAVADYCGCGKAWAAIKGNEVVGLRYMSKFAFDASNAPAWVKAAISACSSIEYDRFRSLSGVELGRIKRAAVAAGHAEFGPRGGVIKASTIAAEAKAIIEAMEKEQFGQYRAAMKAELAEMGEVASGKLSCYQFLRAA